ncbi:T9SS type A sorting domain-containing protein [Cryomorpha ignava]|uniref:T9SS type A sorting domain-containing protein n=1 Tax=Cryomorpha ignava TaxID=101383 RepID=A0A7K3WVC7_9FLAO|nr:T9SS type A sorting domain-containing protein [Cryomorpha ignava]NEN25649.1 T9SS type A sorting domain-containing protein [Cryomorpha ignava]
MIYYNRYRGIIRLFAGLFTPYGAVQSLSVDLTMNSENANPSPSETYTGLLRHLGTYDTPLDQATPFRGQRGVNSTGFSTGVSTNPKVWYTYDFQLGYDPCTCNSFSKLNFEFNAIQSSTISLYGRMITVEEPLVDENGNVTYNQDFLTASSIVSQDPNGYILRSSMDGLIEDYKTSLETYENELEDRQFGRSQWFIGLLQGSTEAIIGGAVGTFPGAIAAGWMKKKNMIVGADSTASTDGLNDEVTKYTQGATKTLLGGAYKYFSNMVFGDNKEPVRPSRPVASFSEMRFSGGITIQNSAPFVGFWTPGTDYIGEDFNPYSYPSYNEVLGLYATLRTPEVNIASNYQQPVTEVLNYTTDLDSNWCCTPIPSPCFVNSTGYTLDSVVYKQKSAEQELYFKLKNPLTYALNPAVDLNLAKTKVYLSYSITLENGDIVTNPWNWINYLSIDAFTVEEDENTNLWLMHDIPRDANPSFKGTKRQLQLSSGWYEVENVTNLLFGSKLKSTVLYHENYSTFTPYCGTNGGTDTDIPNILTEGLHFKPTKIEVKVMADMYFDQLSFTGEEINTTQVFTYLLLDKANGIDIIADQNNIIPPSSIPVFVNMYPGELTIESTLLYPNCPEVLLSNYGSFPFNVYADRIIINNDLGGLGGSEGALYILDSYSEIGLKPGSHLTPNLKLGIKRDLYGGSISYPATPTELSSFCESNDYNSGTLSSRSKEAYNNRKLEHAELRRTDFNNLDNQIQIYPNPANSQIWITSSSTPISEVQIMDISGRVLIHEKSVNSDVNRISLNISSLQSGIYLVNTKSGNESSTQKLVVEK